MGNLVIHALKYVISTFSPLPLSTNNQPRDDGWLFHSGAQPTI